MRGLEIIETVIEAPHSIPEIASICGLTYSTTHRITSVLLQRGYLRHVADNRLGPGPKLLQIGFATQRSFDVVTIAQPYLRQLALEPADTVHLATLKGASVFYLDKIPSQRPVEIRSWVGGQRPAIATGVGKASLLDMPIEELRALFIHEEGTALTGLDAETWLQQMQEYKNMQIAFDLGESEPTLRCVASPIRDASSAIIAAISVTSTVDYMPFDRMQKLIPVVKKNCAED